MNAKSSNHPSKHSVAVLISDGLGLLEFGIAVEVFGLARPEFDFPWYQCGVVSGGAKSVTATCGVTVAAQHGLDYIKQVDTIIVPSWQSDADAAVSEQVINAVSAAAKRGTRILSICSGVFLLAAAGLIEDKTVTTHWKHIARLKALYPSISIDEDSIYIDHHNIICSAGSAAGIDACLYLVRRDFGTKIANDVARRLVSYPHRVGGQKQFIPSPVEVPKKHTISLAMEWVLRDLSRKITVKEMAARVYMSERTFLRRFKETVGSTPMEWLQRMRVCRAQELLENTDGSLISIAEQSGYRSMETFRVAFKQVTGVAPAAYRARFKIVL